MLGLFKELQERGLVAQVTDEQLGDRIDNSSLTAYIGFDPTADSLHVGHLVQIFNLRRLQEHGHSPIAVAGGATGLIGDPSGKSEERSLLDEATLGGNLAKIESQLTSLLDFGGRNPARMLNNGDWLKGMGLLDFLRDVGKHFSVNQMVAKDSVRSRLEEREHGISFTEFSYMLLQSYDFLYLSDNYDCTLQMGASDQWGNITAGIELIRKMRQRTVYGLTTPLVVKADGTKFGKSEAGTIWLDPDKTSPYLFYQYFLRVEDQVVGGYLRSFTWISADELADLDLATQREPHKRLAQRALARTVTALVHGSEMTRKVEAVSEALFMDDLLDLPSEVIEMAVADAPVFEIPHDRIWQGLLITDLLFESGMTRSKSEARKVVEQGGAYLNNVRCLPEESVRAESLMGDGIILLRRGKKDYVVVRFVN